MTTPKKPAKQTAAPKNKSHDDQDKRIRHVVENGGSALIAFRDKSTDKYYVGTIDPQQRAHEFHRIGGKPRINEYLKQHGLQELDVVPTYDFRFDPTNEALIDLDQGFINRFKPSEYRKNAARRDGAKLPPTIGRVIRHALGADEEVVEHFLNWFAVLFQFGERTQTAWILQGTTGTGKGLLSAQIIRPLIGSTYCKQVVLANMADVFNSFQEQTIVLFIDEIDTDQVSSAAKLMARLKSNITEGTIPLRAMRTDLREVPNHLNLILASNRPNAMRIEADDRRFNVAPRQEEKLLQPGEKGEELIKQIEDELQEFADYLMSRGADRALARTALDNEPKRLLKIVTQTPVEEVVKSLLEGDLKYFVEQRPAAATQISPAKATFDGGDYVLAQAYVEFLEEALDATTTGKKHVLSHRQLHAVFQLLVGGMPATKTKLTQLLARQNIEIKPQRVNDKTIRGFSVQWKADAKDLEDWRQLIEAERNGAEVDAGSSPAPEPDDREGGATDGAEQ